MIVAVDTEGNVYSSLTQFNTDSSVMLMFISRLAQQLTKESPDWKGVSRLGGVKIGAENPSIYTPHNMNILRKRSRS